MWNIHVFRHGRTLQQWEEVQNKKNESIPTFHNPEIIIINKTVCV